MVYVLLVILGLALGSFVNALAWRVHKQSTIKSAKKRADYSIARGRSMCPSCNHTLTARDLIPVISWVRLKGKCRYCKKPISAQYPVVEVAFSILVTLSFYYWPLDLATTQDYIVFACWLPILVLGFSLSIIDIKWQLLPTRLVYLLGINSAIYIILVSYITSSPGLLRDSLVGAGLLFSVFWGIYQLSAGKWIGGGDVRLLFVIGLLLGWQKAIMAVVLASYLASFLMLGLYILKRYKKRMRIAFGPFLLMGSYVVFIIGDSLISVYKSFSGL